MGQQKIIHAVFFLYQLYDKAVKVWIITSIPATINTLQGGNGRYPVYYSVVEWSGM